MRLFLEQYFAAVERCDLLLRTPRRSVESIPVDDIDDITTEMLRLRVEGLQLGLDMHELDERMARLVRLSVKPSPGLSVAANQ